MVKVLLSFEVIVSILGIFAALAFVVAAIFIITLCYVAKEAADSTHD